MTLLSYNYQHTANRQMYSAESRGQMDNPFSAKKSILPVCPTAYELVEFIRCALPPKQTAVSWLQASIAGPCTHYARPAAPMTLPVDALGLLEETL